MHSYRAVVTEANNMLVVTEANNRLLPNFVVGAGVSTSTVARAAHDALIKDRLNLDGLGSSSERADGLHGFEHRHTPSVCYIYQGGRRPSALRLIFRSISTMLQGRRHWRAAAEKLSRGKGTAAHDCQHCS